MAILPRGHWVWEGLGDINRKLAAPFVGAYRTFGKKGLKGVVDRAGKLASAAGQSIWTGGEIPQGATLPPEILARLSAQGVKAPPQGPLAAAVGIPPAAQVPASPAAPVVPQAPVAAPVRNPMAGYNPQGETTPRSPLGPVNIPKGTAYIPGVGWKSPAQGGGVAGSIFTDQALAQGAMFNSVLEGYRLGEIGRNRIAQLLAARQARADMGTTVQDAQRWMARQEAIRQRGEDRKSAETAAIAQATAAGAKLQRENESGLPKAQKEWKSFTRTDEYKSMKPEQVAGLKKALTWWRKEGQALEKQSESDLTSIPELLSGDQEKADMYEYLASHGWIG